jgi:hypothetical protein
MGVYIPPADMTEVNDLCAAWANCPTNCKPLLLGDLNINFGFPQTKREKTIADLLDEINLVNSHANMSNNGVDDREKGQDRLGRNGGGGNGISPSQTITWLRSGTKSSFITWRFGSLESMIRIIGPSSRQLQGDGLDG